MIDEMDENIPHRSTRKVAISPNDSSSLGNAETHESLSLSRIAVAEVRMEASDKPLDTGLCRRAH